jgi:hypothetical protein
MLSGMSLLQHLDLQGSEHADATLLQAVGQISTLQSLHLSRCCQIDDAALQYITGLSNLHTLNISMCSKVTDTGLAAVTKLQNLTHLLAQACRDVTDAGVALLGRLTKLQVGVSNTAHSPAQMQNAVHASTGDRGVVNARAACITPQWIYVMDVLQTAECLHPPAFTHKRAVIPPPPPALARLSAAVLTVLAPCSLAAAVATANSRPLQSICYCL